MKLLQNKQLRQAKHGIAILVVIPMLLFVVALGLLMLYMVQAKLQSTTAAVQSTQAKYLARSAIQLALLEIQPATELKGNVRKNEKRIEVLSGVRLSNGGRIVLGGHVPGTLFQLSGSGTGWNVEPALTQHLPHGTPIYVCQDIDGDGAIGSLGTRSLGTGIITAERIGSPDGLNDANTLEPVTYIRGKAKVGFSESAFETAVRLK